MIKNLSVYGEVKNWKKPLHISKSVLAKNYLRLLPNVERIGITGSVGKTLAQNAIASVLSQKFRVVVGDENIDPTFRIPQTILKAKPWDQKIILEYGVEHPLDMDHYLSIVIPKIAVVTGIAPTHTKYLKNEEGVFREKSKLIAALAKDDIAVLNSDDSYSYQLAKITKAKIFWFGKKATDGIKISHYKQNLSGSKFRLHYKGHKASVKWKIIGKHQLSCVYAAATVGIISGLTIKQIAKGLTGTKPPARRLNPITAKHANIIDDTYNSSPAAAAEAVKTLIDVGKNRRKIIILGEMKDLGEKSNFYHEELGRKIARTRINILVTIGPKAKTIATSAQKAGFRGQIFSLPNTSEAIEAIKTKTNAKSVVLVKGSRHAHLERVVLGLLHKSIKIDCFHCGKLN